MADEGQGAPHWGPTERTGKFSVPHRGGTLMEVGEPICVGGAKPWLCIVKLLAKRESPPPTSTDEQVDSEQFRTLLLRSGRGATADEARRDALSQLALVYGSPVGPAPEARISHIDVPPPPPKPEGGWLNRLLGRARLPIMKRVSYWEYIAVEDLLRLQGGTAGDEAHVSNDELLFIVVHQVYELWFKLVLRELTTARDFFKLNPVPDHRLASAVRALRRVCAVLGQAVSHFELVETLTTRDFLAFRDSLVPASGFQSAQLREIEIVLGLDEGDRIPLGREGNYLEALRDGANESPAFRRVQARLAGGPSLKAVLDEWLYRTPIDGSSAGSEGDDQRVERFLEKFLAAHKSEADLRLANVDRQAITEADIGRLEARYAAEMEQAKSFLFARDIEGASEDERRRQSRIRAALVFIESYRDLPLLAWPREVVDTVVELEQRFVLFRQRHARMVERVIGRRTGTGGSAGVEYLDQTALRYRIFRNFWAVRTLLVRESALPALENADEYGFKFE